MLIHRGAPCPVRPLWRSVACPPRRTRHVSRNAGEPNGWRRDGRARAQARTTVGRELPLSALSMAKRGPRPTIVHVSCAPLKCRTVGFPQYGFKPRCRPAQPSPARSRREVTHQVCMLPSLQRFERAFVVYRPSCPSAGMINQPASGRCLDHLGPRVLGSRRVVLSLLSSLLRPDPPVSTTPTDFPGALVLRWVCARRPGLGCPRDLPCFGSVPLPDMPSPLRREEEQRSPRHLTALRGFPQHNSASAPQAHLTQLQSGMC